MKLSDRQRKVLVRLTNGEKLTRHSGISDVWVYWSGMVGSEHLGTVYSLGKRGLIRLERVDASNWHYHITDAGRKALEA